MKNQARKLGILAAALIALALTGCSTTNISDLTKALANDPATVQVNVSSVYGTLRFTRVGNQPGTGKTTVAPDGTITMEPPAASAPVPATPAAK